MPVLKRYQLIKFKGLSTHFDVNGQSIQVSFKGGVNKPYFLPGRFDTTNPELQKAIEESAGYNVDYKLVYSEEEPESVMAPEIPAEETQAPEETPEAEVPQAEAPAEELTPEAEPQAEPEQAPEETPEAALEADYPEVTSVTQAKQKLIDLFDDVKISTLRNRNDVLAKAAEKNITFSNLK